MGNKFFVMMGTLNECFTPLTKYNEDDWHDYIVIFRTLEEARFAADACKYAVDFGYEIFECGTGDV